MKFNTLKSILSLIFIGIVLSNNVMRRNKAQDEGSGTWATGFVCPKIFVSEGANANEVNQGEAKIMANDIVTPSNRVENGLRLEFTNAPANNSLITKVGVKVSEKVYYIPYRNFNTDFIYNNPVRASKTIKGTILSDEGVVYRLNINLPYKTFGWFINDEEGSKLKDALQVNAINAQNYVKSIKTNIANSGVVYLQKNELLIAATKDKNAFDAKLNEQKSQLTALQTNIDDLTRQIEDARLILSQKHKAVALANAELNAKNAAVTDVSLQLNNIENALQGSKSTSEQLSLAKKQFNDYETIMNTNYSLLKTEIPLKTQDFNNSKAALDRSDKNAFKNGLFTSYPFY
jgi:hypothetical protein